MSCLINSNSLILRAYSVMFEEFNCKSRCICFEFSPKTL